MMFSKCAVSTWFLALCCVHGFPQDVYKKENRWIEEGDINIGVILSIHSSDSLFNCTYNIHDVRNVQNVEALSFAVREINMDNKILPNLTLGFVVLDDCQSPSIALARAIQFMPSEIRSHSKELTINSRDDENEEFRVFYDVVGVIGTYTSKLSIVVANVLNLFQLPQISHTATSNILSDKSKFPYFFRMVPPDRYQVKAIASLLSHFHWSHLSIIYSDGSYGRDGVKELQSILEAMENFVCIEEAIEIAEGSTEENFLDILKRLDAHTDTKVVVAFVEVEHALFISKVVKSAGLVDRFIWIGSDSVGMILQENPELCDFLPGSMIVHPHALNMSTERFSDHLQKLFSRNNASRISKNPWINVLQNYYGMEQNNNHFKVRTTKCLMNSGHHRIKSSFVDSFLIDSVYAIAYALDNVVKSHCNPLEIGLGNVTQCVSKVGIFEELKKIRFDGLHGELEFNEDGDVVTKYEVHQCFTKSSDNPSQLHPVGIWDMKGEHLFMNPKKLFWKKITIPLSSCPRPCTETMGTIYYYLQRTCCHICETCKVNEIVVANATKCEICPELTWPDAETKTKCVDIPPVYFGLQNAVSIGLCVIAILGALTCFAIIVILVKYRDEHVIKCFSIELSGIILLGTLLTYGLVASFLTRPNRWKCYVNHVGFSLTYTMIYAPLLVKTNRIYRIFNAGRRTTRKPCLISTSSQVFFSVLFIFCQVAIVIVSTSVVPPAISLHMPRRSEKFVELFCNLPQAGLLSSLSFNLVLVVICTFYAFKTRKLPDNYKESRYIAFCVDTTLLIWITFVPTYFTATRAAAKTTILAISLLLNASVTVTSLFIPRIYSLYRSFKDQCSSVQHNYKDFRIVKHVVKRKHSVLGLTATEVQSTSVECGRISRALTCNSELMTRDASDLIIAVTGTQSCIEMTRRSSGNEIYTKVNNSDEFVNENERPKFGLD